MKLTDKRIVLGVTGGIAAYKSAELVRRVKHQGASVRVIMTKSATQFVTPLTFKILSGQNVMLDLFENEDASIGHITWAEEADAVVIAPATANFIGKVSNGIADDALTTFMMAVTCKVLICPAMNTHMYEHLAVQRNLDQLEKDGYHILEPGTGELACGITGPGRLPNPEIILERMISMMTPKDYQGKHMIVTSGPTQEPIDPVRFISNPSSGKMGFAIARAAQRRGAQVTLVTGPSVLEDPFNVNTIRVKTADQMAASVFEHLDRADIVIKTAAVSDYKPKNVADHKIKKDMDEMIISMEKNIDILRTIGQKKKHQVLVGFAAETQNLDQYAAKKISDKNLDMIVGNIVSQPGAGFGVDTNQVTFFYRDGQKEPLAQMTKDDVADCLLDRIMQKLIKP